MTNIDLAGIKTFGVRQDGSGIEIVAEGATVFIQLQDLLGVIAACSAGAYAICKKMDRVPYLTVDEAQVSMAGPQSIGLEVAFSNHGHLFFELSRDAAGKLADQLAKHISENQTVPPDQKPN